MGNGMMNSPWGNVHVAFGGGMGLMPTLLNMHYALATQPGDVRMVAIQSPQAFTTRVMLLIGTLVVLAVMLY
jgi:hypothetical protein